jgi:hypothetical protein
MAMLTWACNQYGGVKTVEEMAAQREEARRNAQAADKAKMTQNA